jgi:histidine triad (HIT) family protein
MASLFTKIARGEIKGTILYQDEQCFAIADINPQAPKHILLIPRQEITGISTAQLADKALLGHLLLTAGQIAHAQGLDADGYRLVINNGEHAGQTVPHLHIHILGGRELKWPPG